MHNVKPLVLIPRFTVTTTHKCELTYAVFAILSFVLRFQ